MSKEITTITENLCDNLKKSFTPLECYDAEILILGSIPGDRSIKMQQYYGHPQNRFWRVIAAITETELPTEYNTKKEMLKANKIALWDVVYKANRKGSMDSMIKDEVPNAIDNFIRSHPKLKTIAFNGKKAEQMYDRYFDRDSSLRYLSLPSTSPANAACNIETLCTKWAHIRNSETYPFLTLQPSNN